MNKFYAIFVAGLMPVASFAAIDLPFFSLDEQDGLFLNPNLSSVDETYTLDLGFFGTNTLQSLMAMDDQQVTEAIATDYVSFASFTFSAEGTLDGDGSAIYQGAFPEGASPGQRLYAYVYSSTGALVGLFTSDNGGSAWELPADGATRSYFMSAGTPIALLGSIDGTANGVLTAAVPEPSTYAFMAGLMTLGLVVYRRRSRA